MNRATWHPWSTTEALICGVLGLLFLLPAIRWCSSGISFTATGVIKILLAAIGCVFLMAGIAVALITVQLSRDASGNYTFIKKCGFTISYMSWPQTDLDKVVVYETHQSMPFGGQWLEFVVEVHFRESTQPVHI